MLHERPGQPATSLSKESSPQPASYTSGAQRPAAASITFAPLPPRGAPGFKHLMRPSSSAGQLPSPSGIVRARPITPSVNSPDKGLLRFAMFEAQPRDVGGFRFDYPELRVQIAPPQTAQPAAGRPAPGMTSGSSRWEVFALSAFLDDALHKARASGRRATADSLRVLDAALDEVARLVAVSCAEQGELVRRIRHDHTHYLSALMHRVAALEDELSRAVAEVEAYRRRERSSEWLSQDTTGKPGGWGAVTGRVGELYLRSRLDQAEDQVAQLAGLSSAEAMLAACQSNSGAWQQMLESLSHNRRAEIMCELLALMPAEAAVEASVRVFAALLPVDRERFLVGMQPHLTHDLARGAVEYTLRGEQIAALSDPPSPGAQHANDELLRRISWVWGDERVTNLQKMIAALDPAEMARLLPALELQHTAYRPPPPRFMPKTASRKALFGSVSPLTAKGPAPTPATKGPVRCWGSRAAGIAGNWQLGN